MMYDTKILILVLACFLVAALQHCTHHYARRPLPIFSLGAYRAQYT